jgi:hypothetical protein
MQPNNILFCTDQNGQTTSEIKAILDWQLIFGGNPFIDLCRFLIGAVDAEIRQHADYIAFDVYYSELKRLYVQNGQQPPFSRDQVNFKSQKLKFTFKALELYELSICEQTGSYIILLPFVELRKHLLNLKPEKNNVFSKRITEATKLIIPLLEKHRLRRFGQTVNWRQMMYATL